MDLKSIERLLKGSVLTSNRGENLDVKKAFACDLMSDVLALVEEDVALITGLTNIQAIRTAEMKDIQCVIFVRGKKPSLNVIELADEKGITIMSTSKTMFNACCELYKAGITGLEIDLGDDCNG